MTEKTEGEITRTYLNNLKHNPHLTEKEKKRKELKKH